MATTAEAVLVITGSMGSGKTTVMFEASDVLRLAGICHASIDLDALGTPYLPTEQAGCDVSRRNLQCVWQNYAELGLRRLLLATAIETQADLESLKSAVPAGKWVICRLRAPIAIMEARVRSREPGIMQEELVARVPVLEEILDRSQLEDFSVANDGRPVTDVAREVLARGGWL
jgi:phosphosulfolactate synthase (CoM biosynthesis protein A)